MVEDRWTSYVSGLGEKYEWRRCKLTRQINERQELGKLDMHCLRKSRHQMNQKPMDGLL